MNLEAWAKVIEMYDEAAHQGISLSPGVYYDLMRTAVLVASTGRTEALGFAEHCLQEMSHLGVPSPSPPPPPNAESTAHALMQNPLPPATLTLLKL